MKYLDYRIINDSSNEIIIIQITKQKYRTPDFYFLGGGSGRWPIAFNGIFIYSMFYPSYLPDVLGGNHGLFVRGTCLSKDNEAIIIPKVIFPKIQFAIIEYNIIREAIEKNEVS